MLYARIKPENPAMLPVNPDPINRIQTRALSFLFLDALRHTIATSIKDITDAAIQNIPATL